MKVCSKFKRDVTSFAYYASNLDIYELLYNQFENKYDHTQPN